MRSSRLFVDPGGASLRGVVVAFPLLVTASACGGGTKESSTPAHEENPSASRESSEAEAPSAPAKRDPKPSCGDGTCFECGSGYCPAGFFCDDTAPGGAACSWVPSCKPGDCACIERALPKCHCEDTSGPHVRCQ